MRLKTYEIILRNKFEIWERQALTMLYLPIMGSKAYTLYLALLNDGEFSRYEKTISFDFAHLETISALNNQEILKAKRELEALGLINTFLNEINQKYIFYLFAPLNPDEFFNRPTLNNLLIGRIGSAEYEKIRFLFRDITKNMRETDFLDVSASFAEVYHEELNLPDFSTSINFSIKKDHDDLFSVKELEELRIELGQFDVAINLSDSKIQNIIFDLRNAFKLDLKKLAQCIKESYNFETGRLSRRKMNLAAQSILNSETVLSPKTETFTRDAQELAKINELERLPSDMYLKGLLKLRKNQLLDPLILDLIKVLRNDFKLHDSVINVLLDYSYYKNDKKIVKNFVLKIASTLMELEINNAATAMKHFKNAFQSKKSAKSFTQAKPSNYGNKTKHQNFISEVEWTDELEKEYLKSFKDLDEEMKNQRKEN